MQVFPGTAHRTSREQSNGQHWLTLALSDTPTKDNSPVTEMVYSVESAADGVFSVSTQTRYNAAGEPLSATQKKLISQLSGTLVSKSISTDVRGNSSVNWSEYTAPAKVTSFSIIPTSEITAEAISVDGFTLSQKDHTGIITTASRSYTASGMTLVQVDGRGNATTSATNLAGRTISVTDAAGAITTTAYDIAHDKTSVVTDALGNTACYKYDLRGRKIAEWGTALQPACFGYDDMDNMTSLRTFRADGEVITTDPSERSDYDETTWTINAITGLEMAKTYADNTSVVKTYDAYNRLATETDARGNVKTHTYEHVRGLHLGTTYTVVDGTAETSARSFTYNHLGQLTQLTDDSGVRTFGYNSYGERETDSLVVDGDTHLITEQRDSFGRSIGYVYSKNSTAQQTVTIGYGGDGRIATAGFLHSGGEVKQFGYEYLPGSHLLHKLTKPNNMELTQTYEASRNLLTGMAYHRGSTLVIQRVYTYDALGRVTDRNTARRGSIVNDTFTHNSRSELIEALVNGKEYTYNYDNIGNRTTALEESSGVASRTEYTANELNQYTSISANDASAFVPTFDVDGNQTSIKTATGIWSVVYNAENRPIRFTSTDVSTVIECAYDCMGRRCFKKVTINGRVTLHQRYIYRGYLQIACFDLTRSNHPTLWFITWDPAQATATRPLAIQKDGTWYTYGLDLTKNVCEVFSSSGAIRTTYTYTPYGKVISNGDIEQPIQWSCEMYDSESNLIYYNWRYYNVSSGKFIHRDKLNESHGINLYNFASNSPAINIDIRGLERHVVISGGIDASGGISVLRAWTHDKNWRNFITSAILIIQKIKAKKPTATIEWMVERKSYAARDVLDNALILPMPNYHGYGATYVPPSFIDPVLGQKEKEIGTIANAENVALRWFSTLSEFTNSLQNDENGHKRGVNTNNAICTLHYFGHGMIGKLLLRPHFFPWNPDELSVGAEVFKASYFSKNPNVYLNTCHSASTIRKKVPKSLAEQISMAIQGYVMGYDGRIDYRPVADGMPPEAGESINEDADIDPARGTPKNYRVLPDVFDNRTL